MNRVRKGNGPLDRLAVIAGVVFIADFATKQWAFGHVASNADNWAGTGWHLAVINNTHLAWGFESTGLELPLTAVLTIVIAALVLRICRPLTEVDPSAPTMLGLLVGAGAANLADALIPPHGVADFMAVTTSAGSTTSFNVADVVLGLALVLSVRTMWRIAQTMRGRVMRRPGRRHGFLPGASPMRARLVVSAGHALLTMCAFIWLYSMAIALTPDAGRSAPNSLLCGVGVFAIAFVISQTRMRVVERRVMIANGSLAAARSLERMVLDGSIPAFASAHDAPTPQPDRAPRGPRPVRDEPRDGIDRTPRA